MRRVSSPRRRSRARRPLSATASRSAVNSSGEHAVARVHLDPALDERGAHRVLRRPWIRSRRRRPPPRPRAARARGMPSSPRGGRRPRRAARASAPSPAARRGGGAAPACAARPSRCGGVLRARATGRRCWTREEDMPRARTPRWKYVNARRSFVDVEHSIDEATQWAVFEPNGDTATRAPAGVRHGTQTATNRPQVPARRGAIPLGGAGCGQDTSRVRHRRTAAASRAAAGGRARAPAGAVGRRATTRTPTRRTPAAARRAGPRRVRRTPRARRVTADGRLPRRGRAARGRRGRAFRGP